MQYVDKLHDGPEKQLCQRGLEAMKRAGGETPIPIDHFAISSFEVEIHRGEMLGSGGYAEVYRGTYRGRSVAVKMFPRGIHWQVNIPSYTYRMWSDYVSLGLAPRGNALEAAFPSEHPSVSGRELDIRAGLHDLRVESERPCARLPAQSTKRF